MTWDHVVDVWLAAGENYRRDTGRALRGLPCHYCGDDAETLDHVVPRVAGGSDDPSNLVPACRSCNGAKSGRSLTEWSRTLRAEVRRADKRRRALAVVERMLVASGVSEPESLDPELEAALDDALERVA